MLHFRKNFLSIILFILSNILFLWLYNAYYYQKILLSNSFISSILYTPIFKIGRNFSIYLNLLIIVAILFFVYYKKDIIKNYFDKFIKSIIVFGAILQHYTISLLLVLILSPIIFHNYTFQKALFFNGDFFVLPFIEIVAIIFLYVPFSNTIYPITDSADESPIISKEDDLLDSSDLIASITQDLISRGNNYYAVSFGLLGPWGSGKTSIFNLLESHINEQKKSSPELGFNRIKIIRLNVHKYENSDKLYLYFFDELIKEISKLVLLPRLDSFFITKTLLMPFIKGINLDNLLNKVMPLPRIDEYLTKYSSWLVQLDILILCFIDDIDRLINPKDVDAVFKLINIVKLNMSNVVLFTAAEPSIFDKLVEKS